MTSYKPLPTHVNIPNYLCLQTYLHMSTYQCIPTYPHLPTYLYQSLNIKNIIAADPGASFGLVSLQLDTLENSSNQMLHVLSQ